MTQRHSNRVSTQVLAAAAAFATYFCMYAFRKPFTAATLEHQELWGLGLKSVLVLAQLAGYMLSKFIGIKVISEMPRQRRALSLIALIGIAELALVGYAWAPIPAKPFFLLLNGLPLGMVFGLVLAYLEGRKYTEAMTAMLCASFIASSGFVKSVGSWLMVRHHVSEFQMPWLTGLIFLAPLLVSVWVLDKTPDPTNDDQHLRARRSQMNRQQRREFVREYALGLSLLIAVFAGLTIVRTIRDDFAVEIWRDLGVSETPSIFAQSETVVALIVTILNGAAFCIRRNLTALLWVILLMAAGLAVVGAAVCLQSQGQLAAFPFMVACGVGLYVPYVAFHTTVFERLVAASTRPANLGFLMYLADAIGYLGYAVLMVIKTLSPSYDQWLHIFRVASLTMVGFSILALLFCARYFWVMLRKEEKASHRGWEAASATDASPATLLP